MFICTIWCFFDIMQKKCFIITKFVKGENMKKFISILMCALLCVGTCGSLIACGGGEDDGTITIIEYNIGDGGFGRAHADDLAQRFMEAKANVSYAEGKMGVRVDVNVTSTTSIASAKTNNFHVMNVSAEGPAVASAVRQGLLAPIDDVVKEKFDRRGTDLVSIEDKIPEYARAMYQGDPEADGERDYYAVPGYSYSPGITLDENAFNKNGYWLSTKEYYEETEGEGAVEFYSDLMQETFYFTVPTSHGNIAPEGKSAGPDQADEPTQDDGMPTTMVEFVALCEKIKADNKSPFIVAGAYPSYQKMFAQAIFLQLLGKQQLETWINHDGGEFEVVVGYTNEPLFPGFSESKGKIYKPVTKKVNLTQENGFYATWSVAEYYATAFTQLACEEEWWHDQCYNTNHDQKSAMRDFMVSGFEPQIDESLMLVEMNFWYNEAKVGNIPQQYESYYNADGHEERRLTWMSLPTVFYGYTDQEIMDGEKTRQILYTTNTNGMGIAAYVQDNPEIYAACKDFVQFYCSDDQMNRWTAEIGIKKVAEYEITQDTLEKMPWYAKKLGELMNTNCDTVYQYSSTSETFRANYLDYRCGYHGCPLEVELNGVERSSIVNYFLKNSDADTKTWFEAGLLKPENWIGKYAGQYAQDAGWKNLSDAEKLTKIKYSLDENEQAITFNPVIPA